MTKDQTGAALRRARDYLRAGMTYRDIQEMLHRREVRLELAKALNIGPKFTAREEMLVLAARLASEAIGAATAAIRQIERAAR